jgi:hypothetical protein
VSRARGLVLVAVAACHGGGDHHDGADRGAPPPPARAIAWSLVDRGHLPAGVPSDTDFDHAVRFSDGQGETCVVFSRQDDVGARAPDGSFTHDRILHVDRWLLTPGARPQHVNQTRDRVAGCPGDPVAAFAPGVLELTDRDHDGAAEVWFGYRLGCPADGRPDLYKVVALIDGQVFRLRGPVGAAPAAAADLTTELVLPGPALRDHLIDFWTRTAPRR